MGLSHDRFNGLGIGMPRWRDAEVVTTFGLRDRLAQVRVLRRLAGRYPATATLFTPSGGYTGVAVGHYADELSEVVEAVQQVEPLADVKKSVLP